MRVKTTPRQRILLANRIVEPVSEIGDEQSGGEKEVSKDEENVSHRANERTMSNLNANQLENRSVKVKEKDEALNYSEEALDMSIKQKTETRKKDISIASPLRRRYFISRSQEQTKNCIRDDDNNNILPSNGDAEDCLNRKDSQLCEKKLSASADNDDRLTGAVNLCTKDHQKTNVSNKTLKDTVLFKIMTDSAFFENIQNHKRPRRYVCKCCKQEFVNSDELTSHMDVMKEKSDQIEASEGNSSICCSNSNCHLHSEEKPKDFIPNDDNNNVHFTSPLITPFVSSFLNKRINFFQAVASNGDAENHSSITDTSASEQSTKQRECNDDRLVEAINLCKKNRLEDEEESNRGNDATDENLRNTVLFKIMTDPAFLENIQNQKRSRRYMCQFCKQEFMNNNELTDHMDVKKDESNQVVCCACKKTFAQKRYLRYHQRCHSERTKFTCDICTKKYTRMDNLSRHNTFHVNPDKFSCAYCKKTFARKDLLNKHLKCHDSKYRFFCEACQKYFKDPLMLDNHRKNFHSIV
ncbi:Gastrula zinc finger protein XlCGF57.1 (Fragment) [Anthophora plagiata]